MVTHHSVSGRPFGGVAGIVCFPARRELKQRETLCALELSRVDPGDTDAARSHRQHRPQAQRAGTTLRTLMNPASYPTKSVNSTV
jgi:hypothetical protein